MPAFDASIWEQKIQAEYNDREKIRISLLNELIVKLKQYFQIKADRVYIIGSILQDGHFYEFSDIDIAVKGLHYDYFRTIVELEDMTGRDIELVELEKCAFKDDIEKKGLRVL